MDRAYSKFEIRSADEGEERIVTGIASSISADRMSDVVVPAGAKFALPLPLLHQHRQDAPIGEVFEAVVTGKQIRVKARIAKNSGLDYVENAWKQIKAKLVKGFSIGFRPLKFEALDAERPWDGYKFLEWEWLELSAVTVPANADATIQTIKAFDTAARASPGKSRGGVILLPGASGNATVAKRGGIPLNTAGVSK
jgi:HK97 family phage prohead protease